MDDDIDSRESWDKELALELPGKVVLAGISVLAPDGALIEQQQFYGTVMSAHPLNGVLLELLGRRTGEQFTLPPDTRSYAKASPGEYRLRSTGEVVVDPDFTVAFTVHKSEWPQ